MATSLDVVDVEKKLGDFMKAENEEKVQADELRREDRGNAEKKTGRVLFVDVGGGTGLQSLAFKGKYKHLKWRVVLEDIPQTLEHAIQHPGVKVGVQDFSQPQKIKSRSHLPPWLLLFNGVDPSTLIGMNHSKGTKLTNPNRRKILLPSQYPPRLPRQRLHPHILILQSLIAALGPSSVILIDEMVLPNKGVQWQATQLDLTMMSSLAAQQRSEGEWRSLLERAGLRIVGIRRYTVGLGGAAIECVPVERAGGKGICKEGGCE